ncbi:hypothetical protein [Paraburkholderia caribensis]|uniref:hypothetical protein n=1 Tax=Paraburkholderia caribensis TaxID=75105 RepID=UPI00159155EE|nr:hypothetical protein [Paraburkholderia caribensis]
MTRTPDILDPSESLRTIESLCEPDTRNLAFAGVDAVTGQLRPATAADRIENITQFELRAEVPECVRVHFETARNLYVYAWFVYRFVAVAEQQALTTLEFALRERLEKHLANSTPKGKRQRIGLSYWLEQAVAHGVISNARLSRREEWALRRARSRAEFQVLEEMRRSEVLVVRVDLTSVVPLQEDLEYDWIGVFIESLPKIRNAYAHGSSFLHPTVLHTFEIVSDLIHQLYVSAPLATTSTNS